MIGQCVTLVSPNWYCPSSAPNISSRATVWSLSDISFNCWAFRTPYLDQEDMTPLRPLSTLSNICAHTHMQWMPTLQKLVNHQSSDWETTLYTTWATALQNRTWFKHMRFNWPSILIDHLMPEPKRCLHFISQWRQQELPNLLRFTVWRTFGSRQPGGKLVFKETTVMEFTFT